MRTRVGTLAISCAAFDDVTAWCLLAIITVIARREGSGYSLLWRLLGLAAYVLVMLFVVRPLLLRFVAGGTPALLNRFGAVMILLMVSVWATEAMSVHALFGAFVTGVVMPRDDKLAADMRVRLEPVTVGLLLPLFFAFTGPGEH